MATGIVASVITPAPPAVMTKTAAPATYQFDASQYRLVVDQGIITVTGFVDGTQNLAEEPVEGASPAERSARSRYTAGARRAPTRCSTPRLTSRSKSPRRRRSATPPRTCSSI